MIYTEKNKQMLDDKIFKNPPPSYGGAPFWAWNCKIDKALLKDQIDAFKQMGFGGFFMHTRVGLEVEYLGEEFMEYIKFCSEYAKENGMSAWLYDEDRYPSGAAGGFVTRNKEYRARYLRFTKNIDTVYEKNKAIAEGLPYLVACYDVSIDENGALASYKKIDIDADASGEKYYAICYTSAESGWFNNQTYADLLNYSAVNKFIETTYEKYKSTVGKDFAVSIPGIFTDEPQISNTVLPAAVGADVQIPWTKDLEEEFSKRYNEDITELLPVMLFESENKKYRYLLRRFLGELFSERFSNAVGEWCANNNMIFTGHMMAEQTMESQTFMIGEAMPHYAAFGIPGIDMLVERYEYLTAKQAQSVVHQSGKEGMLSELYGVTDWDYDFRGYKNQGDWQAALGVTLRVPHLAHAGMKGEAKRDYPASINYQSPWYKEFGYIENHFARLNTALTRGKPIVKIGVIHPVESFWHECVCGNEAKREFMDLQLENLVKWLLFDNLDFDFISESLLSNQTVSIDADGISIGEMKYSAVLVPDCIELRQSTRKMLDEYRKKGGSVIFAGKLPEYEEGIYKPYEAQHVSFDRTSIVNALEEWREIEMRMNNGARCERMIYTYREDNDCRWLFVCHGAKVDNSRVIRPKPTYDEVTIRIKGSYKPYEYNTVTGEISEMEYSIRDGFTYVKKGFYSHDSLLMKLVETDVNEYKITSEAKCIIGEKTLRGTFSYKTDEENVLLLDCGYYAVNDEEYSSEEEELLRADTDCKKRLGYPVSGEKQAQPWVLGESKANDRVRVKFIVESECEIENATLALENADISDVYVNGVEITNKPDGYYVDKAIGKIAIGRINKGENEIEVVSPFGKRTNIEWMYLLGDFGVKVCGDKKIIVEKSDKIGFSSITNQGLPFYGGNISYFAEVETECGELEITVPKYKGALIKIYLDGKESGEIAFEPYTLNIGKVSAGKHIIELKLFGNRFNSFGSVHNIDDANKWAGPDRWRTVGNKWSYGYSLRELGIVSNPVIKIYEEK